MIQIYITFSLFSRDMVFMATKINLRQYVIVAKPRNFDITDINSLTTEKQTTKFSSAIFQKMLSPSYIILRIHRLEGKQCRSR